MSIPSFSAFPEIPQRSTPEADFDAKMYALFQHFATTHRQELLAFIQFLENNVTAIEGAFQRGDAVAVKLADGRELGRGLVAYSAEDARRIMGHKTHEIAALLGYRGRDEMIHRDDLAIL